jgi:hypothetical protein
MSVGSDFAGHALGYFNAIAFEGCDFVLEAGMTPEEADCWEYAAKTAGRDQVVVAPR